MHRFMSLRNPQLTFQYANKMTLIFALSEVDISYMQISSALQSLFFRLLVILVHIQIY